MSADTQRIRLDLAYDGTHFRGWAAQDGLRTVEGELTEALSLIARTPLSFTVAGRTDAGVHARHQVAHVDIPMIIWNATDPQRLTHRINGILAMRYGKWMDEHGLRVPRGTHDVLIQSVEAVSTDFDARFCATGRSYRYLLADARTPRTPLRRHDITWLPTTSLDCDAMNTAAAALLGEHDFLSYCRPREGATTIRTLRKLTFTRRSQGDIAVDVAADAFCHSMVRSLVGAAIEVGRGKHPVEWMGELLERCTRDGAAPIAPAEGLSLMRVDYPEPGEWAAQARAAKRRRDEASGGCCGVEG